MLKAENSPQNPYSISVGGAASPRLSLLRRKAEADAIKRAKQSSFMVLRIPRTLDTVNLEATFIASDKAIG